jgi:hypothetical protein
MSEEDKLLLQKIYKTLQTIQEILENQSISPVEENYKIVLYFVPIVGIIFGAILLFSIFYWWHKQRIELIRSNLYKPVQFNIRMFSFFLGLLLTFTGFVLSLVFIIVMGKSMAVLGGLVPLAIGLSLLTYYKLEK